MFENITYFFKRIVKPEQKELGSKDAAKERLHLVLMQDRANVSADFLELMKQEIIDVIKKYIVVDESSIDVRLTNKSNDDGTTGAPALYANIPIVNIKNDMMAEKEKKFEGVDFNKEMGITEFTEEELKEKLQPLEIQPIPGQEIEENKTTIIENYTEDEISKVVIENEIIETDTLNIESEKEEDSNQILNNDEIDEYEEDDDDVTFDDLIKAAEAEDIKNEKKETTINEAQEEKEFEKQEKGIESSVLEEHNEESENTVQKDGKKTRGRKKKK